jgi:subtilisin family serine protease
LDFSTILGKYSITPYISDKLLTFYDLRTSNIDNSLIIKNNNNLARIFKINYESKIFPEIAVKKLESLDFIEYIEISPQHKLVTSTNDSLIADCYQLDNLNAQEAWNYVKSSDTVIVGVVDTGVDIFHEDLNSNIYINPGESGLDEFGNDKSKNGIDDDKNGFIDDVTGWDFVSSDSLGQDNLPLPGNDHGTHVAGIIGAIINNSKGIAGVAKNVRILPVKIAGDSPWAGSVQNSYEGLFYAALAGAKVINCSWGSGSPSAAEQEVVNSCVNLGALIVAAAGNDGTLQVFYPAGYNGVLSVAAVNNFDSKASFSNFDNTVDVSAPGVSIMSTIPGNQYTTMSGTSMASPVATGVCAMAKLQFPNYTPMQIAEQVKANCDNIDSINPSFIGLIGMGRVNAYKAVSNNKSKSVVISSYTVSEQNKNNVYEENEEISVFVNVKNVLDKIDSVYIKLTLNTTFKTQMMIDSVFIESLDKDAELAILDPFKFKVIDKLPLDYSLPIEINAYYNGKIINRIKTYISFNPSYKTMNYNDITTTFNSTGNIGFNDYPYNQQGEGFVYKNSKNMLFEGGLMIGVNHFNVSNVVRGEIQNVKDRSFSSNEPFNITKNIKDSLTRGISIFNDSKELLKTDINITERVYQSNLESQKDFIIIHYDLKNNSGYDYDSLFLGLFFDWDIGISSSSNYIDFNDESQIGYCYSTRDTTSPYSGVMLLGDQNLNYFAIDNDGNSDENPGIYDGFTIVEKWKTLSRGIFRKQSSVADVSQVISAGPIHLNNNEEVTVSFALMAAQNLDSLKKCGQVAKDLYKLTDIGVIHNVENFINIYPNPAVNYVNIKTKRLSNINILNNLGESVYTINNVENTNKIELSSLPTGQYYAKITDLYSGKNYFEKFIIIK